ncbi:GNAT family N-acetyltransferase [Lactobacillus hamsteri]|uniref:Acetyltransferase n=1 Tax=Lactobacillus hamsteri DSM 5661 = JCM 6256 TaxID=1423754 RepID=A0A0R1YLM4_9LACO|nr:N-acetyltransferase [Lactobacillus hamsteri]KRM40598.1 acetyltransferase [Lactobacillus hamsteri DSM 5661 = JCM 6256]
MIRKANKKDLNRLMKIWLDSNLDTHDFVPASYWQNHYDEVRNALLQANVFAYEDNDKILGFVGMIDHYLAGIFVDEKYRGHGVGTKLLAYIKQNYDNFSLHVYEKNKRAVSFYIAQGMKISMIDIDQDTNGREYSMEWKNNL